MLDTFQRYAGRRVQRFHNRSPKQTSFAGLGWMRIENFINGKKLLFVRSILAMHDESLYRRLFVNRFTVFDNDVERCSINVHKSPIFDLLRTSIVVGLYDRIRGMVQHGHIYSKAIWRKTVWDRVWSIEREDWMYRVINFPEANTLSAVSCNRPDYVSWWKISDLEPSNINMCENMVYLLCGSSRLKGDTKELNDQPLTLRACSKCDMITEENVFHMVMQCEGAAVHGHQMYIEMNRKVPDLLNQIAQLEHFHVIMSKPIDGANFEQMQPLWHITGKWIVRMYLNFVRDRKGIG